MGNNKISELSQFIISARRILVTSHIRPDGDAVGSVLGMGLALEQAGKDVQMVLADGVPKNYRYLPESERVDKRATGDFDLICVLDSSDLIRVGDALNGYGQPHINIDHHITNKNYAKLNLVEVSAVSTTEILAELIPNIITSISKPIASALLNGIISDTLGFRTSNMTPKALRIAADLMDTGVDLPDLYRRALVSRSFESARFWGIGLNRMERRDRIVWTSLTISDRQKAGYPGRDDADMINVLSSIEGADISIIFVEQPKGRVKVSWRAQPGFDVSKIALQFNGGGHPAAAGAEFTGKLEKIRHLVLQATQEYINAEKTTSK